MTKKTKRETTKKRGPKEEVLRVTEDPKTALARLLKTTPRGKVANDGEKGAEGTSKEPPKRF